MEPAQMRTGNSLDVGKFFLAYLQHLAFCFLCTTPGLPTSIHHLPREFTGGAATASLWKTTFLTTFLIIRVRFF